MARLGLSVSPGFALLAAALYYIGGGAALAAFLTAALAHELGHMAAIYAVGGHIRRVRVTAAGPVIEYGGALTERQEAGVVAAGPAAGLLFAAGCFLTHAAYFQYAGCVAVLASAFNLLPVYPMDGGRLALYLLRLGMPERAAEITLRALGTVCSAGVTAAGLAVASPAMAAAGLWMAALANFPALR